MSEIVRRCALAVLVFFPCAWPGHAATAWYALNNVTLEDGTGMSGTFSWLYAPGDFENGIGQFIELSVPHTSHDHTDLQSTIEITQSIEITLPGSVHDDGVDITLVLTEPLAPGSSAAIDLDLSKYEIGGNGFHDGLFVAGSIVPVFDSDGDGWLDNADNCVTAGNASQRDTDADGIGNLCDADLDNDCLVNFADLGIMKAVFFTADPHADLDGSGTVSFADLALVKQSFFADFAANNPSGIANLCSEG